MKNALVTLLVCGAFLFRGILFKFVISGGLF
jgi:hypothetical protein